MTKRLFRLDLIDSYSGRRRTLLSNKYTNENFYYKPFECSLVTDFKQAFFPELADKFESNFDLIVPTGIGSLWLQSSEVDASYLKSSYDDLSKIQIKTASLVLRNYVQYKIPPNGNGYPYRLDFFFHPGEETLKTLALIHVLKTTESKTNVSMRIKILEAETFAQAIDSVGEFEGIFDLPVGYGCQRGDFYDRSFAVPVNTFVPNYIPHILQLDIVSTQPIDLDHDTDKWKTHQVSVRIVTGRLKFDESYSNDYIILETQDFALKSQTKANSTSLDFNNKRKVASLRRIKRVWDLGKDGLTSKDSEKRAKYYELDERTRQCSNYGDSKLSESVSIEFGISTKENNDAEQQTKTILNLNTELIDTLFTSTQDYHLIMENRLKSYPHLRETIYERRVAKFQLKDNRGNIVWSGPVSFIRKHSTRSKSDVMRQTSSSIYFYSDDLTKLLGKIHMAVIERRTISEVYLHRELEDIGKVCFLKITTIGQENRLMPYHKERVEDEDKGSLDFVLSYPIESKDVAEILASSDAIEEVIYKEFVASMFAVSEDRLNALQLSDIDIDFGPEMIKISGEISEMPALLNYWQDYGQKFSVAKQKLFYSEKNIENEESCARNCLNYNCYMFSFCSNSKKCDVLLTKIDDSNKQQEQRRGSGIVMTFEPDSSCSVFRPIYNPSDSNALFISPRELVQKLRETVLSSKEDDNTKDTNILKLELRYTSAKHEKKEINLNPLFLTSGSFISEEVDNLLGGEENGKKVTDKNNRIEPQYKIIFENRKYKDSLKISQNFPIQLAQHTSFDGCKSLCSETDCRSFSHCKIESTCRVSMLQKFKHIREFSDDEELCTISQRDYLSKFRQTSDKHVLKLRKISKTTIAGSANDCASDCMEEDKFKCKSFYYCRNKRYEEDDQDSNDKVNDEKRTDELEHDFSCYLRKTHLSHLGQQEQDSTMKKKTSFQIERRECHLYTRKFKNMMI